MVTNVTSLTGNGLKDWLIQRITAIYFAVYLLLLFIFFIFHSHLSYNQWHNLCANQCFKIATMIAFLALTLHSWIGIWTVTTDYIKCAKLRIGTQLLVLFWLLSQFFWGVMIFWGL